MTPAVPRACATCGASLEGRSAQTTYCYDCAYQRNQVRDRQQRRERYAAEQRRKHGKPMQDVLDALDEAQCPPDPAVEAWIDRNLRAIRARGGYHLTDEIIWSRTTDALQAAAPDTDGLPPTAYRSPDSRERSRIRQRACRARQKGRAVA